MSCRPVSSDARPARIRLTPARDWLGSAGETFAAGLSLALTPDNVQNRCTAERARAADSTPPSMGGTPLLRVVARSRGGLTGAGAAFVIRVTAAPGFRVGVCGCRSQ